jgi:secreted trypsin-like serine protease
VTKVRLGEHKVTRLPGKDCLQGGVNCLPQVQDFDVSEKDIITHPDYKRSRGQVLNDIALIRLPRSATFNDGVQPACLPTLPELASEKLNVSDLDEGLTGTRPVVVGWGHTTSYQSDREDNFNVGVPKAIQQMLEVPVLSSSECGKLFLTPEKSQICAGGDRGKDSCRGDSGGPLFLRRVLSSGLMDPNNDHDDPWFLLGLVSFGTRVCGRGKPGIYTRVEAFVPWILQNI